MRNSAAKMRHLKKWMVIWYLVCLLHADCQDNRRPFYNVGHMANTLYDVTRFLKQGANGIETDITFSMNGIPIGNFHGVPCDCWRDCIGTTKFFDYLGFIRQITTPGSSMFNSQLAFLLLDLKVSDLDPTVFYEAGKNLADAVIQYLYDYGAGMQPQLWIVLTVPSIKSIPVLVGFTNAFIKRNMTQFLANIGYDVYSNEEPKEIVTAMANVGITSRIWMGDGLTNCIPIYFFPRLTTAVDLRDNPTPYFPFISKAYAWTIDDKLRLRYVLRATADAVLTNEPAKVIEVLQEPEFIKQFRLANIDDIPWVD